MNKKKNLITNITLWVNRGVGVMLGVLIFALPAILDWYREFRWMTDLGKNVLMVCFYFCAAAIFAALWNMDRMLAGILRGEVFVRKNVNRIRWIQLCCGVVSLICIPAAVAYMPLVFLCVIMAFLCLVVSVVASVMDAAVTLREENDLTI